MVLYMTTADLTCTVRPYPGQPAEDNTQQIASHAYMYGIRHHGCGKGVGCVETMRGLLHANRRDITHYITIGSWNKCVCGA